MANEKLKAVSIGKLGEYDTLIKEYIEDQVSDIDIDDYTIVKNDSNELAVNDFVGTRAELESALESGDIQDGAVIYVTDDGQAAGDYLTENDVATVALTGSYSDLENKPTFGTAATKDVPTSGDAANTQVVMGNDSRLTDARNAADVSSWAKASTKPSYTAAEVGALADTVKYAGAASAGGAATSAEKLTNTNKVGDTDNPVYFTASGVPAAINYTIGKSVPSDAVFTDTTYESKSAASGGTDESLVTTGEKYTWNSKAAGDHSHGSASTSTAGFMSAADKIKVDGMTEAASKSVDTTVTQNSSNLITSGAVWSAIDNLPEPMVFKGSLGEGGTITSLPTAAASNEGWTYKVITNGTYASIAAKIGDVFVCGDPSDTGTYSWILIPGGESDTDTWRNIKVNGTEKLGNGISTGAVDFVNGTNTTVAFNATGNKVSVSVPAVSSTSAGVAPQGAAVSSQSQSTKFLREDGTWAAPSYTTNTNTTYTFATGDSNGQIKVTPSNGTAQNVDVKGLGTAAYTASSAYATSDHSHSAATTSAAGFMTTAQVSKLNGIAAGATANTGTVTKVTAGTGLNGGDITTSGTISVKYGSTANTAAEGNHTHGNATTTSAGFMTTAQVSKLNGIAEGAQVNTVTSVAGKTGAVTLSASDVGAAASSHSHDAATTASAGFMTTAQVSKLNGIAAGAQVNSITGVKGNSESSYRTGNVNLTAANIGAATSSHTHGNITSAGALQTSDITIANGDKLVVTDSSDSSKVARASIAFDGSTATKALTQKGTWETFGTSNLTLGNTSSTAAAGNHTHGDATTSAAGFMTTAQVTKLNGIAAGAQVNTVTSVAGKTGAVTLSASDVGALASTTKYAGSSSANGAASTALRLNNTSKVGDTNKPVYFTADGVPSAISYTIDKSVPSNAVFTDTNNAVTQTADTTNSNFEVLFSGTADNTTRTEGAKKATTLRFNPSLGSLMEGSDTVATGSTAHAEGYKTTASGNRSHAEGYYTSASGLVSHAEGYYTTADGSSHAEGEYTKAIGDVGAHAEGRDTIASGESAHAEGRKTTACGQWASHAEGIKTCASGSGSHAEGGWMDANGQAEYNGGKALGNASHAEGSGTTAYGLGSHAEGYNTAAIEAGDHAEGLTTCASGGGSHAEGDGTRAQGYMAHAEGKSTTAYGTASHAGGCYTYAKGDFQTVIGKYNSPNTTDAFQIGWGTGTATTARKNIFSVDQDGNAYATTGFKIPTSSGTFALYQNNSGTNADMGWNYDNSEGAGAAFRSAAWAGPESGAFIFWARNSTNTKQLVGRTDGVLTWDGSEVATQTWVNSHLNSNKVLDNTFASGGTTSTFSTNISSYRYICVCLGIGSSLWSNTVFIPVERAIAGEHFVLRVHHSTQFYYSIDMSFTATSITYTQSDKSTSWTESTTKKIRVYAFN